ncbi:MAG: tetratricopeptide repeat protein [Myxococcales bacterium]|nr:tetratricopeptide repeat protein [Myxococcales bacterium]
MSNPPSQMSQVTQRPRKKRGRAERKRMFSNTMAVIKEDPHDVKARLTMVELLQEDERVEDSVGELLRVASVYTRRGVPIKAVAVLRQAVKLQPARPDVRMAYGEVFASLRMIEDAAREYREAYELYKQAGNLSAMLDALSGVTRLDPGNLHANLMLAESLSRAGRNKQAAVVFARLAEHLLEQGATADWEQVAERAVFHNPANVTLAHDLALHYVRSAKYGAALSKLIVCYEREPNDAELLELIVETLEYLGVRDRAATLTRRLVRRYRRGGLMAEAERALERLYGLDPDDEEAKAAMGALAPAVAPETVIELEQHEIPKMPVEDIDEDGEIGFGGDFIDELMAESAAPELPAEAIDDAPALPDDAFSAEPDAEEEDETMLLDVISIDEPAVPAARPAKRQVSAPRPAVRPSGSSRPSGRQPAARPAQRPDKRQASAPRPAVRQPAAPRPTLRKSAAKEAARPQSSPRPAVRQAPRPAAAQPSSRPSRANVKRGKAPPPAARVQPKASPSRQVVAAQPAPAQRVQPRSTVSRQVVAAQPAPARPVVRKAPVARARLTATGPDIAGRRGRLSNARISGARNRFASQASDATEMLAVPPDASGTGLPAASRTNPEPAKVAPPTPSELHAAARDFDSEIGFDGGAEATVFDPGLLDQLKALDNGEAPKPAPSQQPAAPAPHRTTLTAKRRSNSLPRPRLTRARFGGHEQPARARGVSNDLKTLDFFIERGFYESAVALVDELAKRHPNSEELRVRRQRIAQMNR